MHAWESVKRAFIPLPRRDAVPPALTERAVIPGIAGARFWADRDLGDLVHTIIENDTQEREALGWAKTSTDPLPPAHLLAISGGGDAGAFAAGILTGWTQH